VDGAVLRAGNHASTQPRARSTTARGRRTPPRPPYNTALHAPTGIDRSQPGPSRGGSRASAAVSSREAAILCSTVKVFSWVSRILLRTVPRPARVIRIPADIAETIAGTKTEAKVDIADCWRVAPQTQLASTELRCPHRNAPVGLSFAPVRSDFLPWNETHARQTSEVRARRRSRRRPGLRRLTGVRSAKPCGWAVFAAEDVSPRNRRLWLSRAC